jgi:hypothetical protein
MGHMSGPVGSGAGAFGSGSFGGLDAMGGMSMSGGAGGLSDIDLMSMGSMGSMETGASAKLPSQASASAGAGAARGAPRRAGPDAGAPVHEDDIPLLEELGIDFREIGLKTAAIVFPFRLSGAAAGKSTFSVEAREPETGAASVGGDGADLAGPLVFCLLLGTFLLLAGKVHFGYIYGFGITGCALLWLMLNLMADAALTLDQTMHVLGYSLAPIVSLAGLAVLVSLKGTLGHVVSAGAVLWSTAVATRCFEASLGMREQRYLIAYPVALLYSCFALLAIF